jgi:hypothetical protein
MARTLKAPGPLDSVEEAFDLLQRAPASVWLEYLAGAVPLLIASLYAWNAFAGGAATLDPAMIATFLVVLLVWFYRCRQRFAVHLLRSMGVEDTKRPIPTFAVSCFEGVKLLAMPLAVMSLLPAGFATAFFRSLALYAGQGLPARQALSKAWNAAKAWQRENWMALAILSIFGLVVFLNVALTVIVAPSLVRMFTGYESAITSRGFATISIQLPVILLLTWLCFDPLLQALYVVRCFAWESTGTGEDLIIRLRRLAPLLVVFAALSLRAEVTRDQLNHSVDRTLESSVYNWRIPPAHENEQKDWFIGAVDHALAVINNGWRAIEDLWRNALDWIDRMLRRAAPGPDHDAKGQPSAVRPAFYALAAGVIALALVLLWKFRPKRLQLSSTPAVPVPVVDLADDSILASDLPEEQWLRLAEGYAASGDLRLALRALYLGSLALLARQGMLTIHACKSNRDYERELRRRSRSMELGTAFRESVLSFERSWYGFHEVTTGQLDAFRNNLGRLRSAA